MDTQIRPDRRRRLKPLPCAPAASPTSRASARVRRRPPPAAAIGAGARARPGEQGEQLARPRHVAGLHHAVVEHHADRAAGADPRREALVELLRRQPRDVEVHRQLRQQPERLRAVLAREQREAELDQHLARVARAAVPGRREERVDALAEQLPQPRLAGGDVRAAAPRGRAPGRTRTCALRPGGWCARSRADAGRRGTPPAARRALGSSAGITARSSGRPCSAKRAISSSRRSSSQPASSSRKKTSTGAAV